MLWSACATPPSVDCPTAVHVEYQTESGGRPPVLGGSMQSGHKRGLRTWQFVDAKAGDGSSAAAWVWGMAVHPPVTRAMAVRARS